MIDLDILLVFEEETLEVLSELENATSIKAALTCLKTVSRSSKLVELPTLTEVTVQVAESIRVADKLNNYEIKKFVLEARSLIQGAIQRAEIVKPQTEPKSAWWKIW